MIKEQSQLERIFNKTIKNYDVIESNITLWTPYLDNYLRELVLLFNFNFNEIATRFQDLIALPYKYDFSEEEVSRHWAFLHASRELRMSINEEYYESLRNSRTKKQVQFSAEVEKEKALKEEKYKKEQELENQKRIEHEKEILRNIDLRKKEKEKDEKIEKTNKVQVQQKVVVEPIKNKMVIEEVVEDQKVNSPKLKVIEAEKSISFFDMEKKKEHEQEHEAPDSVNSSFSGDENDHLVNIINIEKSQKIPELNPDKTKRNVELTHHNPNELISSQLNAKDDFIENLFSAKTQNNQSTKYKFDFYPENKVVTSKDFNDLDDFPLRTDLQAKSKYNLEEDDEEIDDKPKENESKINKNNIEDNLKNTKDMYSFIKENEELNKQSNNLDVFCDFAVKSLKHLVPKLIKDMDKENYNPKELNKLLNNPDFKNDSSNLRDIESIESTTYEVNKLLGESIQNSGFNNGLKIDKENEEEENKNSSFERPTQEDMSAKLNKFKEFMFKDAMNLNASDLLGKIANIIEKDNSKNKSDNYQSNKSASENIQQMFLANAMGNKPLEMEDVRRLVENSSKTFTNNTIDTMNSINSNTNSMRDINTRDNKELNNPKLMSEREELNTNYSTNEDTRNKKYICYRGINSKNNRAQESDNDDDDAFYNQEE